VYASGAPQKIQQQRRRRSLILAVEAARQICFGGVTCFWLAWEFGG